MPLPTVVRIDLSRCINCSLCRRACPTETIHFFSTGRRAHVVDPAGCIGCDICIKVCPVDCIDEDPDYVIEPTQLAEAKERARTWARRRHEMLGRRKQRAVAAATSVAATRNGHA